MAKLLMPKEIYQTLIDSFFLAASVNCNAYLEFRVQGGIIRTKFSDTEKLATSCYLSQILADHHHLFVPMLAVEVQESQKKNAFMQILQHPHLQNLCRNRK